MKQNFIFIFCFIILIIFSIYVSMSKPNNIFEGILANRQLNVAAIINDTSISPNTKIKMIKLIELGDGRYARIINDPNMKDVDKVEQISRIYT